MWRWISASVRGTSHETSDTECQDHCLCESLPGDALLVVASDGAGSAPHSGAGARLACESIRDRMLAHFSGGGSSDQLDPSFLADWQQGFVAAVLDDARREGLEEDPRLFACTLVGGVTQGLASFFFQIGDGAIVIANRGEPGQYRWVFWPDQGEFESTTYFATDLDALEHLRSQLVLDTSIDEIAVFTDGLQRLALQFHDRVAHQAFFAPLFAELRRREPGPSPALSSDLARFLDSPRVNQRTDDDKTLLLASRTADVTPELLLQ